jgi:hypothetical protein
MESSLSAAARLYPVAMEDVLRFLRRRLRFWATGWSSETMNAARFDSLDRDPSQGLRHVFRLDRVAGG